MKFIVITLLFLISFSGCIGDNDAVGKKTDTKDVSTITAASPQQPSEKIADQNTTPAFNSDPTQSTVEAPKLSENTTTPTTPASTTDPIPTTAPTSTTPVPTPNVTTTTVEPPSPNPNVTTTTIAPNVTTTTISPNVTTTTISPNVTTTTIAPNPNVTTTTVAPPVTTTKRPTPTPCRRFDGPSFIGGIVLAVGLMAISVVAYKFYKARTDRNYHTL